MQITRKPFGLLSDGQEAELFTLTLGDMKLSISSFGAAWTSLVLPGKTGRHDVLLGFSTLEGYLHDSAFFGATIGRFANRIANGVFSLDGKRYQLYKNDGDHSLHGGRRGFNRKVWQAHPYTDSSGVFVRFELESPDGEEGYPAYLKAAIIYGLTYNNEITADYSAALDAPCPLSLTNHAYFNLTGEGNGDILSHELCIHASSYVESGPDLIPTGKLIPVAGTPFAFISPKPMGKDYTELCGGDTAAIGKGYDHCFVLDNYAPEKTSAGTSPERTLIPCAEVSEPVSGRKFKLTTTQPGVQFYSGNFLNGVAGKTGSVYKKNAGFCLETQHFPDSPNQPGFPSAIFGPDRPYHERAVFAFEW